MSTEVSTVYKAIQINQEPMNSIKFSRALSFAKTAFRHVQNTDDPIRREIFWDALNGRDRYDCDDFTDEDKAREYFQEQFQKHGGKQCSMQ